MGDFVSSTDIVDRETAISYLANKPGSLMQFFSLPWEKKVEEGELYAPRSAAGPFTVLHSTTDGWWEVGYDKKGSLKIERFFSMEECVAYIVCRWW